MSLAFSKNTVGARPYRTLALTSQVDEALFASKTPLHRLQPKHNLNRGVAKMLSKGLIVDPSGESVTVPSSDWQPMSQPLAKEKKGADQRKNTEKDEREDMKRYMINLDLLKEQKKPPSEKEQRAQARKKEMLDRANALRMDQEEEVREVKSFSIDAKCQAMREVQIQEKKRIKAELVEDKMLLDLALEEKRCKAIEDSKQKDKLQKEKHRRVLEENYEIGLKHDEDKRALNEEKKQKRQKILENEEKLRLKDLKALEMKREAHQRLREDNVCLNAIKMQAKERMIEEEKLAGIKNKEYREEKMKQEEDREEERSRSKKERELAKDRMFAQQDKARQDKAEQDKIYARRLQEITERKWRRKALQQAVKEAHKKILLNEAHVEGAQANIEHKNIELIYQKSEFERLLKVYQEDRDKEKVEKEKKHEKVHQHREELLHQIKENELSAKMKRKANMQEAQQLILEANLKHEHLAKAKEEKLKELRATGLPEIYCSGVERKVYRKQLQFENKVNDRKQINEGKLLDTMGQMMQDGKSRRQERQQEDDINNIQLPCLDDKEQHQPRQTEAEELLKKEERLLEKTDGNIFQGLKRPKLKPNRLAVTKAEPDFHLPPISSAVKNTKNTKDARGEASANFFTESSKQSHNKASRGYQQTKIKDLPQTRLSSAPTISQELCFPVQRRNNILPPIRKGFKGR
ncbi:cilia- and flagella-associated protein 45-like [Notolabrus celidotus]|uniref:cilia- and flagella-associated protein 45-like n=1 Tax=Notolabrus celidotus TaxID=1203425 RepID=UPI00148F59F7|nr:cilia- and flagella-associated protein 45-like [Notolabrus celidotus]